MLERLRKNDRDAYQTIVTTFLKANENGYWVTNSQNPTNLRRLLVEEWRNSGALSSSRHSSGGLSSSRHGSRSLSSSNHGRSSTNPPLTKTTTRTPPKPKEGVLATWRRRRKASNGRDMSSSSHGELSSIPPWRRGFSTSRHGELSRSVHS